MKPDDFDLDQTLRSAKVPERPASYWEAFPGRITHRLKTRREAALDESSAHAFPWAWSLAAACLLLGLALGWFIGGRPQSRSSDVLAQNEKIYREISGMFPNRVRAIISDEEGVHLTLSEKEESPSSEPLLLRVCTATQCQSIVTFSGQQVTIQGRPFDVLIDASGRILLIGQDSIWTDGQLKPPAGFKHIEAQRMGTSI